MTVSRVGIDERKMTRINYLTDSDYVYRGLAIYLPWWMSMNFVGKDGSEIKHRALWQELENLAANFQKIKIVKSKAHRKKGLFQWGNDEAEKLIKAAALVGNS